MDALDDSTVEPEHVVHRSLRTLSPGALDEFIDRSMRAYRALPSPALRPHLHSIVVVDSAAGETTTLLPEPGLVVAFRVGGAAMSIERAGASTLATAGVTGLRTTLRRIATPTDGVTVVAAFRPLGAARFFGFPLQELFGSIVPLSELVGAADVREIESRLAEVPDTAARTAIVDAFLVRRLARRDDALVGAAVDRICRAGGSLRIRALARELGTSQDPLEKRFRRVVGASPKQFASIVRFRRAVGAQASKQTLAALAHATGYFDQSHLAREFRAFTGESPSRFFEKTISWDTEPERAHRERASVGASMIRWT
jgi:AraC-like DNA-binding protein